MNEKPRDDNPQPPEVKTLPKRAVFQLCKFGRAQSSVTTLERISRAQGSQAASAEADCRGQYVHTPQLSRCSPLSSLSRNQAPSLFSDWPLYNFIEN